MTCRSNCRSSLNALYWLGTHFVCFFSSFIELKYLSEEEVLRRSENMSLISKHEERKEADPTIVPHSPSHIKPQTIPRTKPHWPCYALTPFGILSYPSLPSQQAQDAKNQKPKTKNDSASQPPRASLFAAATPSTFSSRILYQTSHSTKMSAVSTNYEPIILQPPPPKTEQSC